VSERLQERRQVPHLIPYPSWIDSDGDKLRFDLCVAIACEVMRIDPESAEVWAAARALFRSDLPT